MPWIVLKCWQYNWQSKLTIYKVGKVLLLHFHKIYKSFVNKVKRPSVPKPMEHFAQGSCILFPVGPKSVTYSQTAMNNFFYISKHACRWEVFFSSHKTFGLFSGVLEILIQGHILCGFSSVWRILGSLSLGVFFLQGVILGCFEASKDGNFVLFISRCSC